MSATSRSFGSGYARASEQLRETQETAAEREAIQDEEQEPGTASASKPAETESSKSDDGPRPTARTADIVRLDTIKRERVEWLWVGRIPLRKITDLYGDGDLGKSTLLIDLAARITRGRPLPSEPPETQNEARNCLLLSAEDGLGDTIRPRFDEAGGEPKRLFVLTAVKRPDGTRDLFSLSEDIETLKAAMIETTAAFVIIDPFSAYLGQANSWKDQEVRRVLASLADATECTDAALVILRHPHKGRSENPMHAAGGSIGISAACRSGLMVVKDPDDENRRLLATYKHNLCMEPATLGYRLTGSPQAPDIAIVIWDDATDPRSAKQLLMANGDAFEEKSARGDARRFLKDYLVDGPKPSSQVIEEAKREHHSIKTLRRALHEVGEANKKGFDGGWLWRLK